MKPTDMTKTTDEVIDRFDRAFQERDATILMDTIAPDRVMESVQPAPDGTRYEKGYDASFSSWNALIDDTTRHSEVEDVHTGDEWALILALRKGSGSDDSVRGVNVIRVVDGKIKAAGYTKTAPIVPALES
jgi:ketosteroid isomerase-like protein